jgi:NAD(P)H-dependent FMN reductase
MLPRIAIVIGSTRPGRVAADVAGWVLARAGRRQDATFEVVDIAELNLPLLDEPAPAALSSAYVHEHTRRWSAVVAGLVGFVFVSPEHNHSVPASLKNAIDYLFVEWNDKAAGFVSYGVQGGIRAVEHLRQVLAEVRVADVRTSVALSLFEDFVDMRQFRPRAHHEPALDRMLDELVTLARTLTPLRGEVSRSGSAA